MTPWKRIINHFRENQCYIREDEGKSIDYGKLYCNIREYATLRKVMQTFNCDQIGAAWRLSQWLG